jgi:hypothetical protein
MFNYDSDALRQLSRERADELAQAYRQSPRAAVRESRLRETRRRRARLLGFLSRVRSLDRAATYRS